MDYCSGGSVLDVMTSTMQTLTEDQIGAIVTHVLKGLVYLHSKGIVHRGNCALK